jgi:predicted DNA-binding transcriptional regulator AlpA
MKEIMEPENARRFSELPDEALIDIETALWLFGNIGRTKWYKGVKAGRYPKQVKDGHSSRWRAGEIRAALNNMPRAQ